MKPDPPTMRSAIAIMVLAGIVGVHAQTVLIRNQKLDLSPIIEWLDKRKGDRPMPHWKVVGIDHLLGKGFGGAYRAGANVDGQLYKGIILIQNIPTTLLKYIAEDDATLNAMADIEGKIELIERLNREIDRKIPLTIGDNAAYAFNLSQRAANNNAIEELRISYSKLSLTLRFTGEAKKSKFLAYFTGQKVGEFEVWDCGSGSKVLDIEGLK